MLPMQMLRGLLITRGLSKGSNIKNEASGVNIDKCYELAYLSVQEATQDVMEAVKTERKYSTVTTRRDLVTKWNALVEDMLYDRLSSTYPEHKYIAQEKHKTLEKKGITLTDEPTWFIDPISGTMNFVHGFPYVAISVGFFLNKNPQFSIVWNPILDQCFMARHGMGAYMNVRRIRVSKRKKLRNSMVMHKLGSDLEHLDLKLDNIKRVASISHAMRCLGSTNLSMCMVATGLADAYYEFGCHAWELAAARLVVEEAGGVILDPKPSFTALDLMSRRVLVACTPELAIELSKVLVQIYPTPRDDEPYKKPKTQKEV